MKIAVLRTLAVFAAAVSLCAQPPRASLTPAPRPQPKLLLAITVDQFRYDYLTRFRKEYNGGLARLLTQGAVFTNAFYQHSPTVTAIGHSTILSGASPIMSGIVGNEWYDRETGKNVTSVSDLSLQLLGAEGDASSPHRLMVTSVPDEIKMSGRGESHTIGISIKDRSAILPAGRMADGAYWFSSEAGVFVSSTWYMKQLPAWVSHYNATKPGDRYLGRAWQPLTGGKALHTMPSKPDAMYYGSVEKSPFGNEMIEEFAELAIENEQLGSHPGVDVLAVSFSSNDYVGHAYGPDSEEAHDICVRTDRVLAKLFAHLEKKVGMKNVVVTFTADHGVGSMPEVLATRKLPGGRLKESPYREAVEKALTSRFGAGKWVVSKNMEQLYLDPKLIAGREAAVRELVAATLRNQPHVFRVYTKEEVLHGNTGQDFVGRRVANGYHAVRGPDVVMVVDPNYIFGTTNATHGSPFNYDAHVPVIVMAPGVKPGRYNQEAAVNDIAPTVATLLDVEVPSGSMGRVLYEALAP